MARTDRTPAADWLTRLRAVARAMLITQRVGWLAASTLAILLIAGAADFVLRTPDALRIILWIVGVVTLAGLVRRTVWPAVRFRPSLTEVALRVENSPPGRAAGLGGLLASGLELSADPAHAKLADTVIADARARLGTISTAALLAPTRTVRSVAWLVAAVAAVGIVAALEPGLTRIGASRVLWPFASAPWPKRTGVADITGVTVHPLGSALALRAAVNRSGGSIDDTRVAANYRTIVGGAAGPVRQVLLTSQDRVVRVDHSADPEGNGAAASAGYLFERLLEPSGLGADSLTRKPGAAGLRPPAEMTLEYWFETEDDRTEPARVLLVEPPTIVGASAVVQLPAYAASMIDRFPELARAATADRRGAIDLGPGNDARAAAPPVLAGSRLTVDLHLNKPVPGLPAGTDADVNAWIGRCVGPDFAGLMSAAGDAPVARPTFAVLDDGATWRLSWTIESPLRLSVKVTDAHGITGAEEANYRFDAVSDNPPSVVVTTPTEDKSVLAGALVDLAAEARDDVGLSSIALERRLARKPAGSEGAPVEPVGERVEFARVAPAPVAPDAAGPSPDTRRLATTSTLDLSELELSPGDELWITALAADVYDLNGARHEPVRSAVRKLRIMSREELVRQVWGELSAVRRTAVKIDDDQKTIAASTAKPGADQARRNQRAQSGITERIARQSDEIKRLQDRVAENGLTDQGLRDVLREAQDTLARAGERSVQASDSLNKAEKAQSADRPSPSERDGQKEREQAAHEQEQVRDQLGRLIDMLDQGEDTYTAKRSLEQILQEQKDLQGRTEQAGRQTTGKQPDQLSPQEKQALGQIAADQRQAAEKLKDAIDKMLEREQKLQKHDPAAAQQMSQAAKRGQREQTAQKMEKAAQQVQQNNTNDAQQQQAQAIQSLEQMLKELDKTAQARDEVLRRYLASLIDSIRGLIAQQQARLDDFHAAVPDKAFTGLDGPMARLHQATLGVLDEARNAPREAADALSLVDRAADAQSAAVVALRDNPVNQDEVGGQEQLSLDKLNEALAAAEKIDQAAQDRQNSRKRAELRQKYEEALKTQVSLRESSLGLVGAARNRRNAATARQLGGEQNDLRTSVDAIRAETAELREAGLFDYAHTRLNNLMQSAGDALAAGEATDAVVRDQAASARLLTSLIEALADGKKDDRNFREREQEQGGGGGSGEQPLVPPAAELKLLRLMQIEAAERTRDIAEHPDANPAAVAAVTRLQRDLATQAKDLLDRVSKRPGAPKPGAAPKPADAPPPEPATDPAPQPEPQP